MKTKTKQQVEAKLKASTKFNGSNVKSYKTHKLMTERHKSLADHLCMN